MATRVGLIADTHGLLRPEATAALAGSDRILHAGDIGSPAILTALQAIAPVTAVRGNNDVDAWGRALPERVTCTIERTRVLLTHDVASLDLERDLANVDVVVAGHSHRARNERRGRVLLLNPGSAGPRRFTLPVSVASLAIDGACAAFELHILDVQAPRAR